MKKKNEWDPLAGGGNNEVYVNFKTRMVFKTVHNFDFETDTPERSVRLWNLLNPTVRPKAKITTVKIDGVKITGWTCPYIQNQYSKNLPPSIDARAMIEQDIRAYKDALQNPQIREQEDLAIMHTLIDIYNRSGRIIVDAPVVGNFVTTEPGKAICIDIGMALLLEKEETDCLNQYARRNSFVSNDTWGKTHEDLGSRILQDSKPVFPATMQMTKALLFIRTYRPDIASADFLKTDMDLSKLLATAYDTKTDHDQEKAIEYLNKIRPVNLMSMKKNCTQTLLNYIHSRGTLDEGKIFHASWVTKYFRQKLLTNIKIERAQSLINTIDSAQSIDEIQCVLQEANLQPLLKKGFSSDFGTCLGLCVVISQVPPSPSPELVQQPR